MYVFTSSSKIEREDREAEATFSCSRQSGVVIPLERKLNNALSDVYVPSNLNAVLKGENNKPTRTRGHGANLVERAAESTTAYYQKKKIWGKLASRRGVFITGPDDKSSRTCSA